MPAQVSWAVSPRGERQPQPVITARGRVISGIRGARLPLEPVFLAEFDEIADRVQGIARFVCVDIEVVIFLDGHEDLDQLEGSDIERL
jgi:hypothetical protein